MHCVSIEKPEEWPHARVYVLADLHIGDPNCDIAEVRKQIERIRRDEYGLVILNGDLLNTAIRTGISDIYGETIKPMQAIKMLVDLLEPIKGKVIGATTGNHEWRVYRDDGIDIMRLVCRELGVEKTYCPEGVFIFLRVGTMNGHSRHMEKNKRQLFTIYATHGTGGGRKEGAKAIRMADMECVVDADIYIHAHTHQAMDFYNNFYRVSPSNNSVKKAEKLYVNSGAAMDYGGYGQMKEFKPASVRTPVIFLEPKKARATAALLCGDQMLSIHDWQ